MWEKICEAIVFILLMIAIIGWYFVLCTEGSIG